MKKIILIAVAVIALAGCSTATTPVSTVTVTQQAPAPTQTQSLDDKVLEVLRSQGNSYLNNASDAQLLDLSSQICPILNNGVTVRQLLVQLANQFATDNADPELVSAAGIIVGVSVAAYCPQYSDQVQSL